MLGAPRPAHALVVTAHRLGPGPWQVARTPPEDGDNVGLLVLAGVIVCELTVADHVSAELLGPGDLLRPWRRADSPPRLASSTDWAVLSPTRLAVIDQRVAAELPA